MMTERVLKRLPDLRLADDGDLPLRPANFVSGLEAMPVVFTPSAPLLR
ncbi:cytochrome P450 family protein [Mycobacterium avium subsp. avium 2285 (R)]|nr:cytochrome P450 family protein [Mycobacterium avium subsp. avium 2285 (R)]